MIDDLSPMPWGTHVGKPMQDVPASYLFWLWATCGYDKRTDHPLHAYIKNNLSALKKEYPDGIW